MHKIRRSRNNMRITGGRNKDDKHVSEGEYVSPAASMYSRKKESSLHG